MLDIEKIRLAVDDDFDKIANDQLGNWIDGIFWTYYDLKTFEEEKEAFFILLKKLIDEQKIVIFPPEKYWIKNTYSVPTKAIQDANYPELLYFWDECSETIVNYMRSVFPPNIINENDMELYDFWYGNDCVRIGWINHETGEVVAS